MDKQITFTKEQLELLYPAEVHFQNAIETNSIRNCSRQLIETVRKIYESATDSKTHVNTSCSVCRLKFLKLVGNIYFNDKKYFEEIEEKVDEPIELDEPIRGIGGIEEDNTTGEFGEDYMQHVEEFTKEENPKPNKRERRRKNVTK